MFAGVLLADGAVFLAHFEGNAAFTAQGDRAEGCFALLLVSLNTDPHQTFQQNGMERPAVCTRRPKEENVLQIKASPWIMYEHWNSARLSSC